MHWSQWEQVYHYRHGYRYLLISLMALLVVHPFLSTVLVWKLLFYLFLLVTLGTAVVAASWRIRHLVINLVLGLVTFSGGLFDYVWPGAWGQELSRAAGMCFFGYVGGLIAIDVGVRHTRINEEMIYGALCAYLFMGIAFAYLYSLVVGMQPEALHGLERIAGYTEPGLGAFIYFSFVTLTTLGFGDITPASSSVGALVYMEAILGQIYLTVLVARLVGLYIAQRME